jgi:hypothetical protein
MSSAGIKWLGLPPYCTYTTRANQYACSLKHSMLVNVAPLYGFRMKRKYLFKWFTFFGAIIERS